MNLTAEQIAAAIGAEVVAEGGPGSPDARRDRLPGGGARRPLLRPAGRDLDGGEFAAAAIEAGAWGVVVAAEKSAGWMGLGLRRRRSARRAPVPRPGLAPRARRPGRRGHRLGRQDLGQGHRPGAAAGAGARQPREPQHRDRPAADRAGGARRHRAAGPGDGDARPRPDRRAGRDRRARGRGDHQRRPGPRRAARLGRGDRGGEGGDPRRAAARRRRGGAGRGGGAGAPPRGGAPA